MARLNTDTDSDEYEVMSPGALLSESVNCSQNAQLMQQQQHVLPGPSSAKKDKPKKKKGLFRKLSKDKTQKVAKKPRKKDREKEEVIVVRPSGASKEDNEYCTYESDQPPKPGPKPPKKITEEEMMERLKQQQLERVEQSRKERLRRISESEKQALHTPEHELNYTVDRAYGEVDVGTIVSKYSDQLPLKVVVSKGIYGTEEKYSLAASDICVIHFVRRRELVQLQDPTKNTEFLVPINTAIKFSVVYNPNNLMAEAIEGLTFKYVSDVLAQSKLPKMGLARLKDPNIIGVRSSELLVIKEVLFPENTFEPRKLRVYSLTAKCTHDLVETTEINLSTKPSQIQCYLTDILKHIPDPVPLHVAMFRNSLDRPLVAAGIPSNMFGRCMYLKKRFTDILLIATGCSGEGEEGGGKGNGGSSDEMSNPFEIPMNIDVDFEVIKLSEEEQTKMKEDSDKLREKLRDRDIRSHRYVGMSDEQHRMQVSLYKATREGVGGVSTTTAEDDNYVRATSGNRLPMEHRVELLEENIKRCCHSLGDVKSRLDQLTNENEILTQKVQHLEETVVTQNCQLQNVETVKNQLSAALKELDHLKSQLRRTTPTGEGLSPARRASDEDVWETNKSLLANMSQSDVVQLLQLAGLAHHTEVVISESITGDILLECEETTLENELGISSRTDRLKLLRIIEGKADRDLYQLRD